MAIPDLIDAQIFVATRGQASCSEMMTEFEMTYTDAVQLMDRLEIEGVVGPATVDGKPRGLMG